MVTLMSVKLQCIPSAKKQESICDGKLLDSLFHCSSNLFIVVTRIPYLFCILWLFIVLYMYFSV